MSLQDGGCSYASSANMATASGSMRRRLEDQEFSLRVYPGALAEGTIYCPVSARKNTTAAEAIECLIERLHLDRTKCYVLAEVKEFGGEEWILNPGDCPVQRMMLWPRSALENRSGLGSGDDYRFLLREKNLDGSIHYGGSLQMWLRVTEERRRMVERGFLPQPAGSDPPSDLCTLPELTERAILESLRTRFRQEKIYTYIGSILIVINPFQFLPIYNPKYVKLYDNHTLGKLEPHIYAVADVAYHAMLQRRRNQCIVISGESGSGKTQSTNFLIHHLTALSQKGFASGVEQIILGAGPVLEQQLDAETLWAAMNALGPDVSFETRLMDTSAAAGIGLVTFWLQCSLCSRWATCDTPEIQQCSHMEKHEAQHDIMPTADWSFETDPSCVVLRLGADRLRAPVGPQGPDYSPSLFWWCGQQTCLPAAFVSEQTPPFTRWFPSRYPLHPTLNQALRDKACLL
ncbi:Unconventional myosin-IXa [Nibea albiflora]|uniref:Unconventional myosin-IXa n=1 Tax=Nibea albiflora TaxID=240163 RepID=A0ACB7FCP6_NIBAL|nr:Unconventional myosin-IXa [Nibea albiflora]